MHDDFPAPVAPGDEEVRHLGQVDHDRTPGDVATERHLQRVVGGGALRRAEDVAQRHQLAVAGSGTSTPIADFPGMGARIRTSGEAIA